MIIAVAQPRCEPGDITGNLARIEPLLEQAARAGARLVLLSEAGVTGYEAKPRTLEHLVVLGDATCRQLHALARRYDMVIAAGFLERNGAVIHNTQGVFYPDGALAIQRKTVPAAPEKAIPNFQAGPTQPTVFTVDGVRCGLSICADNGLERRLSIMAEAGVQVHLAPCAGCGPRSLGFAEKELDDPSRLEEYLKKAESVVFVKDSIALARRHRMVLAACNQMADDGADYFHPGHSCIIDSTGELVALIPGSFVFEHLRPRVMWGEVHPQPPASLRP